MKSRMCENCIKHKTIYFPNSDECLSKKDKLFYEDKYAILTKVEALDESKYNSIERLDIEENAMTRNERYIRKEDNKFVNLSVADYELAKKINELIDEINNLKEK